MEEKYKLFWKWFLEHQDNIIEVNSKDSFVKELDKKVKELGNYSWEIGPGKKNSLAFTISPGGDKELLEKTKKIIGFAPNISGWEFYSSIQIKEWSNFFTTFINGKKIGVDISKWKYVLYQFEDGTYDIAIKPIPFKKALEDSISELSEMIVDSLIGEEKRIEKIVNLDIVPEFDSEIIHNASKLINLNSHLQVIA